MLCLTHRFFPSYELWHRAAKTGADLLWRVRQNARLEVDQRLPDGSYLSRIYASTSDRRNQRNGIVVRVIDYRLHNVPGSEPVYRLITTILDPVQAPAKELASLKADEGPGWLSFRHTVRVVQRRLARWALFPLGKERSCTKRF